MLHKLSDEWSQAVRYVKSDNGTISYKAMPLHAPQNALHLVDEDKKDTSICSDLVGYNRDLPIACHKLVINHDSIKDDSV